MALLSVKNLAIKFGGLMVVKDFNVEIEEKEIVGLIGPNGAGKTTVFNMLTGVYKPTSGAVFFQNERIDGKKPYEITARKIARTFQNIRLLNKLTVLENVMISYDYQAKSGMLASMFRLPSQIKEENKLRRDAMELLRAFGMEDKAMEKAENLPYGQQRKLEIARALAANPKLLLLDEPAAGMNPQETAELTEMIRWIRDKFQISILLIEHDMKLVMNVCEKIVVLSFGEVLAEGKPEKIQNDPKVIEAYLGKGVEKHAEA